MRLTVSLEPAAERTLSEQAQAHGRSLDQYAADLITWTVLPPAGERPRPRLGTAEWLAEFHAWADSREPAGQLVDDSRESIFGGSEGSGE